MPLAYNIEKLKMSIDEPTYDRAVRLFQDGKVTEIADGPRGYAAIVKGTEPYRSFISVKDIYDSGCDCYLGQNDTLCKHCVALAIAVLSLDAGAALDLEQDNSVRSSDVVGTLSQKEAVALRKLISATITQYIRSYEGPSRTWFAYQDRLEEGCNRLAAIVRTLPVCTETAELLCTMLVRLDKKLSTGGVDDSNGTVGSFMFACADVLCEQAAQDESYKNVFEKKVPHEHVCFDWNEKLIK